MKGFIAACLAHVPAFQRARLKVPMHFAFSYDEEIGCLGAHSLAERLVGAVPRPQAVIVGEPTMMGVVNAQNAGGGIVATFTGVEAHSSMTHLGVSAIHFAGDFIHWLNELQVELAERKRTDIDTVPGHTTINVGIVTGGTAGNILARECTLNWGYRTLPGDDPWEVQHRAEKYVAELLLPKMKARHPDANITLKRRSFVPEPAAAGERGSRPAGAAMDRRQPHLRRALRHRGRHLPRPWHPDRDLRPRRHLAGPPAQRIRRQIADGCLRQLHRPDDRLGGAAVVVILWTASLRLAHDHERPRLAVRKNMIDQPTCRRRFLQFLAASPLLAGAEALAQEQRLPDPSVWGTRTLDKLIASPREASTSSTSSR